MPRPLKSRTSPHQRPADPIQPRESGKTAQSVGLPTQPRRAAGVRATYTQPAPHPGGRHRVSAICPPCKGIIPNPTACAHRACGTSLGPAFMNSSVLRFAVIPCTLSAALILGGCASAPAQQAPAATPETSATGTGTPPAPSTSSGSQTATEVGKAITSPLGDLNLVKAEIPAVLAAARQAPYAAPPTAVARRSPSTFRRWTPCWAPTWTPRPPTATPA